jgi:hypothetical protein
MLAEDLAARVAKLESKVRRDRTIALGALAILFVTAQSSPSQQPLKVSGPNSTTEVTAAGIVISDANGKQRIYVGFDSEGRPSVDMRDATGQLRETLYLAKEQSAPAMRQFDSNGKARTEIGVATSGNPSIKLMDQNEKERLSAFIGSKTNAGEFAVWGPDENVRGYLVAGDGGGYLALNDGSKIERVWLGVTSKNQPDLELYDTAGKRRVAAFIGAETAKPEFAVYGADEEARGYLVGEDAGAYFGIKDSAKTSRAYVGLEASGTFGMFVNNSSGQTIWRQP